MNEDDGQDLVYYYSREHRLKRASRQVRELNEGSTKRPGFFKSLVPTKAHLFMLLSILMACVIMVIGSRSSGGAVKLTLRGNTINLEIKNDEGVTCLFLKKLAPKKGATYTGQVAIAVSPALKKDALKDGEEAELPPVFTAQVFFTLEEEENYRVELPPEMAITPERRVYIVILQSAGERAGRRVQASGK